MLRKWIGMALFALAAPVAVVVTACGTDAIGIDACRQIETARCKQAPACNISLAQPVHRDSPTTDVDACIRYYHDACLHGLSTGDPGAPTVQACVDAINTGDCATVLKPEKNPACTWVKPPDAVVPDAAADSDAAEAASTVDATAE
jgi:hypothetical protein